MGALGGISVLVAALALIAAVRANMIASRSVTAAEESAAEAKRSANAAEDANAIAEAARAQALEVVDVEWQIERTGDKLAIRNVGSTTAFSVAALIRVDGERFDVVAGDVTSDEPFACDAAHVFQAKRQQTEKTVADFANSGIFYVARGSSEIEARVSWQSSTGVPHVQVVEMRG